MSELNPFINVPLILFLILLNGFFVASEFAFVKVRKSKMIEFVAGGSRRARISMQIIDDLDRSLSSTQLGITLASIALGFVGEPFFTELFILILEGVGLGSLFPIELIRGISFVTGYFFITFGHVVIGELAPKSISIQFAERTALWCAEPLWRFMQLTGPILAFFVWSSNRLLGLFKISPVTDSHGAAYSEEELKIIIGDSIEKGELEPYESKLIYNILDFTDQDVKSVLTPRIDVEALEASSSPEDILRLSVETGFSRIPIYESSLDKIIGFVHVKDVIAYANGLFEEKPDFNINNVLRPVIFVPEGKSLDDLLKEMQQEKTQVSVVVDEYGTVEGIATLEDILEFIVGPIDDEFDPDTLHTNIVIENGNVIAGGLVPIGTFNSTLNEVFGEEIESEESVTLSGYVLELFESEIPSEGMKINDDCFQFTVLKIEKNRIEEVQISKINSDHN